MGHFSHSRPDRPAHPWSNATNSRWKSGQPASFLGCPGATGPANSPRGIPVEAFYFQAEYATCGGARLIQAKSPGLGMKYCRQYVRTSSSSERKPSIDQARSSSNFG